MNGCDRQYFISIGFFIQNIEMAPLGKPQCFGWKTALMLFVLYTPQWCHFCYGNMCGKL